MLAAGISSGISFDRDHNDAIDDGLGLLRSPHGILVVHLAHGVAAVSDDDHDFPSLPWFQRLRAEIEGIVECRRRTGVNVINAVVDGFEIGSETGDFADDFAELIKRQGVNGTEDGASETPRRGQLQRKVLARTEAGIDRQNDRKWQSGFFIEDRNLLRPAVFEQVEVVFLQAGDGCSVLICDGHKDVHQLDVDFEGAGSILRQAGKGQPKQERSSGGMFHSGGWASSQPAACGLLGLRGCIRLRDSRPRGT